MGQSESCGENIPLNPLHTVGNQKGTARTLWLRAGNRFIHLYLRFRRFSFGGSSSNFAVRGRGVLINARPATKFGVGLLAVVDGALSWPERPGLYCLHDGCLLGWDAGSENAMVCPGRQPV